MQNLAVNADALAGPEPRALGEAPRVLLISMPWAKPTGPSLALGLLKGVLQAAGLPCDTLYGNLKVGRALPLQDLTTLSETPLADFLLSPVAFDGVSADAVAEALVGGPAAGLASAGVQLRGAMWESPAALSAFIRQYGEELDAFAAEVPLALYDIVGFSLMFEQTVASLAFARRLKRLKPELAIVFGGASCDGEMGPAFLDAFDYVDYAVSGDADESVVGLVRAIRSGLGLEAVAGLSRRAEGRVLVNPSRPTLDLDRLPPPVYDDYFRQLKDSFLRGQVRNPVVPFETSRGCWWGQKHLCSFCGLNGTGLGFRRKSQERAIDEILALTRQYRAVHLMATDNILDQGYFSRVLPQLSAERREGRFDVSMFFEVKSNLKKEQMKMLADAGIRYIQPGIESFSDHILELMDKGATAIQQVQLIRWCEEFQITPYYNIIVRNPGETVADYESMTALLPFISHLLPPVSEPIPMMLQRFSPYFNNPARYGISNVRPAPILKATFGLPDDLLARLVYNFEYDHADQQDERLKAAVAEFEGGVRDWKASYRPFSLYFLRGPGFVRIVDKRGAGSGASTARVVFLSGRQAEVFEYCDQYHSRTAIVETFDDVPEEELQKFLDKMVSARLMWRDGKERYISLPVRSHTPEMVI